MMKTRKAELILYGYGTRTILELDDIDADFIDVNEELRGRINPKREHRITLRARVKNLELQNRKYLSNLKRRKNGKENIKGN